MQNTFKSRAKRLSLAKYIISFIILVTLFISAVYTVFNFISAPSGIIDATDGVKSKNDYLLMLTQCLLGIIGMLLPAIVQKYTRFRIPDGICILYFLFIFCAIFLGEVLSFYYTVPMWDSALHAASAVMLTLFALITVEQLCQNNAARVYANSFFISFFAFSFAVTIGVLWEIYEFSFDAILGLNMQKFRTAVGEELMGRAALFDTMKDLIVDTVAAFFVSAVTFISRRKKQLISARILANTHNDKNNQQK